MDIEGPLRFLLIGVLGAGGAIARYSLDTVIARRNNSEFPWGILTINVLGCFLIGVLMALTAERLAPHPGWRIALGVGFLGAFTTFSAFSYDTVRLMEDGATGTAITYVLASVTAGLLATLAGLSLARLFT
ncbi:MAG: fluoride efflux transporter CrcB [Thermoleophilaceae bacterium]|nr:fluoride efflux transporter CrcB [Thermoleophilaceae bacterium]